VAPAGPPATTAERVSVITATLSPRSSVKKIFCVPAAGAPAVPIEYVPGARVTVISKSPAEVKVSERYSPMRSASCLAFSIIK
jgi:hypothetical protein